MIWKIKRFENSGLFLHRSVYAEHRIFNFRCGNKNGMDFENQWKSFEIDSFRRLKNHENCIQVSRKSIFRNSQFLNFLNLLLSKVSSHHLFEDRFWSSWEYHCECEILRPRKVGFPICEPIPTKHDLSNDNEKLLSD